MLKTIPIAFSKIGVGNYFRPRATIQSKKADFKQEIAFRGSGLNLIKLLGAYLGAKLSQVNGARRLNRCLKVL
jgi:hypothetical protein